MCQHLLSSSYRKATMFLRTVCVGFLLIPQLKAQFQYGGGIGGANNDEFFAVETNNAGDYWTGGYIKGSADVDPGSGTYTLTTNGSFSEGVFLRYDANDHLQFIGNFDTPNSSVVKCLKSNQSTGHLIVGGEFYSSVDIDPGPGVNIISPAGFSNMAFIVKLDAANNYVWHKVITIIGNNTFLDVINEDANGNIYMCGRFDGTADLDPGPATYTVTSSSSSDRFLVKLDASGNFTWGRTWGASTGSYNVYSVVADYNGSVFLSGHLSGTLDMDPGSGISSLSGQTQSGVVVKLSSAGDFIWNKVVPFWFPRLTIDKNYHIITGGPFTGTIDADVNAPVYNITTGNGGTNSDMAVVKYDTSNFNLIAAVSYGGTNGGGERDFETDAAGNIYITGQFTNTVDFDPGPGSFPLTAAGTNSADIYLLKLDSALNFLWAGKYSGPTNFDFPYDLAADDNGVAYICGKYNVSLDLHSSPVFTNNCPAFGADDAFFVKTHCNSNYITGIVFEDLNNNAIKDSGEPFLNDLLINLNSNTQLQNPWLNNSYQFIVDTGNYYLSVQVPQYYISVPQMDSAFFGAQLGLHDSLNNFAVQAIPGIKDLRVDVVGLSQPRPGFSFDFSLIYTNAGTDTIFSDTLLLVHDTLLNFSTASQIPDSVAGDSIRWYYQNLLPGETRSIQATFSLPPDPNLLGDSILLQLFTGINVIDTVPSDNMINYYDVITGSYDPNFKEVFPPDFLSPAFVAAENWLYYTVHFQNTGTDTAFGIYVLDTLDYLKLNVQTFEMLSASHNYDFILNGNGKLRVYFDNILLPDSNTNEQASHGYFKYRVRSSSNLVIGDTIFNTAFIYFDYNPPIVTNTTESPVQDISLSSFFSNPELLTGNLVAYPNPFAQEFYICYSFTSACSDNTISLFESGTGRQIETKRCTEQNGLLSFNTSDLAAGLYVVKVAEKDRPARYIKLVKLK